MPRITTASQWLRHGVAAVLLVAVAASLVAGVAGGLLRAGVFTDPPGPVLVQAAFSHAALMIGGFLGTVIGVERAVALQQRWALLAPFASGLAALLLLSGHVAAGAAALLLASTLFVFVNVLIVRRQPAAHTALLLLGALAWLAGSASAILEQRATGVVAWWFVFVVLTIAAERLEMARLLRLQRGARALFFGAVAALTGGAALASAGWVAGEVVYGAALSALGLWFGAFDIARRTVRTHGLSRYMAACLLAGYAWLVVAGIAWAATALGLPMRDAALHAFGLGFVLSMVLGHAPVILPAITRVKLEFGVAFYFPLALLHGSLMLRLADPALRSAGALLNSAAIVVFALTVVAAAMVWRVRRLRVMRANS